MGLLRNRDRQAALGSRYQMRQRLLSIGDDYWIEAEDGRRVFRVDGKALRIRKTLVLEDAAGNEVAKLQERKLSVRDKMEIERDGDTVATVSKRWFAIRDTYGVEIAPGQNDVLVLAVTAAIDAMTSDRGGLTQGIAPGTSRVRPIRTRGMVDHPTRGGRP